MLHDYGRELCFMDVRHKRHPRDPLYFFQIGCFQHPPLLLFEIKKHTGFCLCAGVMILSLRIPLRSIWLILKLFCGLLSITHFSRFKSGQYGEIPEKYLRRRYTTVKKRNPRKSAFLSRKMGKTSVLPRFFVLHIFRSRLMELLAGLEPATC